MARIVTVCGVLLLGGCYTMNQEAFESFALERASEGTPASVATKRLAADGFNCGDKPVFLQRVPDSIACTRKLNGFLYACLERIEFQSVPPQATVAKLTIGKVSCAGL
jgi:hypothetical protein